MDVHASEQIASDQPTWRGLEEASLALDPSGEQYRRRLAENLGALVCDPYGAPYVARALVTRTYVTIGEPPRSRLAALGDSWRACASA